MFSGYFWGGKLNVHLCFEDFIKSQNRDTRFPCPECREPFAKSDIRPPFRFMRNMMSDIQLLCPLEGCDEIVSYDNFKNHQEHCSHNIVKCEFCDQAFPKRDMNFHQNDCNNFIRQKMAELVAAACARHTENETIKTELAETKLQLNDASLKLTNADLEIQRLKQELRRKNESTSSSETISLNQETGLNIY